jgi:hypothetical protein
MTGVPPPGVQDMTDTWYMPVLRVGSDRWLAYPPNGIRCKPCKDGYYAHANSGSNDPFPLSDTARNSPHRSAHPRPGR